ncbi:MAG: SDR family oxidoreductase [Chloroflexaceae bacterium]|nr:SDR family oxidoreductase [Chloroflexaceae bacterium]NJO04145.1 SDR family oxidoreductase [Chloroflexaceae bacterium]
MRTSSQTTSSPRRLLVTGGTGYLGGAVVQQALRQHWDVTATAFNQPPFTRLGSAWHSVDICDVAALCQVVEHVRPDVIIHTAFRQNDPNMWQTNARGSKQVAIAASNVGARLIHISSDVIFDGESERPYTEADPPNPITPYGESKADAERLVLTVHLAAVIVRTSLIYGFNPVDRHTQFILSVADGQNDACLFRDELRCPVYVADLAAALLELAGNTFQGIINLAGAETVSRYELGTLLAAYHGRDPARIVGGLSSEHSVRRPRNCALDIALAQQMLHTPLRGIRAVLAAGKP